MPREGDEGYEDYVLCPYDRAHEIRKGRMQFHLQKCRVNHPNSPMVDCPFNSSHRIPQQELQYHIDEDCRDRSQWERFTHETEAQHCPVKDLVPVNAATVSDGGENWDNVETDCSPLTFIQETAKDKPILRMLQVVSKAQRKAFRKEERLRHQSLQQTYSGSDHMDDAMSTISDATSVSTVSQNGPLPRPKVQPKVAWKKMDANEASAIINKQFKTLDIESKALPADVAPFESATFGGPPPKFETASTSRGSSSLEQSSAPTTQKMPFSYAAASQAGAGRGRPSLATPDISRPNSAMSNNSFASVNRPGSAMSGDTSFASAFSHSPGATSRPTSGMSNATFRTANRPLSAMSNNGDGFCQVPIPGVGRGRKPPPPPGFSPL